MKGNNLHNPLFALKEIEILEEPMDDQIAVVRDIIADDGHSFDLAVKASDKQYTLEGVSNIDIIRSSDYLSAINTIVKDFLTRGYTQWFVKFPNVEPLQLYETHSNKKGRIIPQEYYTTDLELVSKFCEQEEFSKIERIIKQL